MKESDRYCVGLRWVGALQGGAPEHLRVEVGGVEARARDVVCVVGLLAHPLPDGGRRVNGAGAGTVSRRKAKWDLRMRAGRKAGGTAWRAHDGG